MNKAKIYVEERLFSSIVIITIANLIAKFIGVIFKIPLHNYLGDLGMGYFNTAYNIFVMLYIILTTGIPTASMIMISEYDSNGKGKHIKCTYYLSLIILLVLGLISSILLFIFSDKLAYLSGNINNNYSIKSISFAILFLCVTCAYKGYFQGLKIHFPSAISSIIEAIGKFIIGILLAIYAYFKGYSIEYCSAFAIFGVVIGEILSMIFMIITKYLIKTNYTKSFEKIDDNLYREVFKKLIKLSFPIFLSAFILNIISNIDTFTIVNILKRDLEIAVAERLYGNYSTLAITLFRVPSSLIIPISTVLLPKMINIKCNGTLEEQKDLIEKSLKIVSLVSIPSLFGLAIYSKQILLLLFKNTESVEAAFILLSILSLAIVPSSYLTISSTILQAYGKENKLIISTSIGVVVKLLLNLILINNINIGIYGAPIASIASYCIMAIINRIMISKYVFVKYSNIKTILKILISTIISFTISLLIFNLLNRFMSSTLIIIIVILLTVLLYLLFVMIFKLIAIKDIKSIFYKNTP